MVWGDALEVHAASSETGMAYTLQAFTGDDDFTVIFAWTVFGQTHIYIYI